MFDAFFGSLGSVLEPGTILLLLAGVAVGFVVGILAAWWPGWRAARLDILRAVTTE